MLQLVLFIVECVVWSLLVTKQKITIAPFVGYKMSSNNSVLKKAKVNKNDEFYTLLYEIEDIMSRVDRTAFKDKIVYLPCDRAVANDITPVSNFVVYFKEHFFELGLKRLVISWLEPDDSINNLQVLGVSQDGSLTILEERHINGDFRSNDVKSIIDMVDIVVTNPPFSLFSDFFTFIKNKKFLVIGSNLAALLEDVFPYIKRNECFVLRMVMHKGSVYYATPSEDIKAIASCWYSNLYFEELYNPNRFIPTKNYSNLVYKHYDNTNIIDCWTYLAIPKDYDGVMGVPVTFLQVYNPNQFEIIGMSRHIEINNIVQFGRIFIKYKNKNINTKKQATQLKRTYIVDYTQYLTKQSVAF